MLHECGTRCISEFPPQCRTSTWRLIDCRFVFCTLRFLRVSLLTTEDMRAVRINRTRLPWIQARQTTSLSSYGVGCRVGRPATTNHQTRAIGYTTHGNNYLATRTARLLKTQICPKTFCRARSSTRIANSTTSTLPTTISADATVSQSACWVDESSPPNHHQHSYYHHICGRNSQSACWVVESSPRGNRGNSKQCKRATFARQY